MAFWLAIHMENVELAGRLLNWDLSLRYIAILALKGKGERPKDFKGNKKNAKFLGMGTLAKREPKAMPNYFA